MEAIGVADGPPVAYIFMRLFDERTYLSVDLAQVDQSYRKGANTSTLPFMD